MAAFIIGFIVALILAAVVVVLITYCMFCRERHKSEVNQYNIEDIRYRNQVLPGMETEEEPTKKKNLTAAIFVLPGRRHKHKDDSYERRPDYPENPTPVVTTGTEELIKAFNDNAEPEAASRTNDYCFQIESESQYHSEV